VRVRVRVNDKLHFPLPFIPSHQGRGDYLEGFFGYADERKRETKDPNGRGVER
jgi:hypothetical protein